MKKLVSLLIIFLLAIPALTASSDAPFTFTVRNNTTYSLGTVLLNHPPNSSDSLSVSGYGTFAAQVDAPVPSITINGQTITYPNSATVTLSNGVIVRVRWESPVIVIVDTNEL